MMVSLLDAKSKILGRSQRLLDLKLKANSAMEKKAVVKSKQVKKKPSVKYFFGQANDRNEVESLFQQDENLKTVLRIGKAKYLVSFTTDSHITHQSHPRLTPCLSGQGEQIIAKILKALGIVL